MVAIDSPPFVGDFGQPSIRPYSSEDHAWAVGLLDATGGRYRVRRGRVVDTAVLAGLVGTRNGTPNTLVTISRHQKDFELTAIASDPYDADLVEMVIRTALKYRRPECLRAYAICSNAHFDVQRSLQRCGFRMCATRPGSVDSLARRSPHPIATNFDGLGVRDEVEFDLFVS